MRKILAILLVFIMMFSTALSSQAAFSDSLLKALGVMPELSQDESGFVTRDKFAAIVAAAAGFSNMTPAATAFLDVGGDNPYSGAIKLVNAAGYMSGIGGGLFAPGEYVTRMQAATVFVKLLGYTIAAEEWGGWPDGYQTAAQKLGIYKTLQGPADEAITWQELWDMCDYALETPATVSSFTGDDGNFIEEIKVVGNSPTLMEKNLHTYKYEGVVQNIEDATHSVEVKITEAEDDAPTKVGEVLTLKASTNLNILTYDKMDVEIFVADGDRLLYLAPAEDVESWYGIITTVNGDENISASYVPAGIDRVMFLDDKKEYDIADSGLALYYNGQRYYNSIRLIDRYARVILREGEITAIEIWDMSEGGIVTDVNYNNIQFIKASSEKRITDIDSFERRMLVLDGEVRDWKELKTDMLIDFYISSDKEQIVVFASQKKHTDIYSGYTSDSMGIGNIMLLKASKVYGSLDGIKYDEKTTQELMNKQVCAYVDIYERVRYICPADGAAEEGEFLGYLIAQGQGTGLSAKQQFKIVNLDEAPFTAKIYNKADKMKLGENLTNAGKSESDVYATAGDDDGDAMYKFRLNSKGEVRYIDSVPLYYGFEQPPNSGTTYHRAISFPESSTIYSLVGKNTEKKKLYYDSDVRIIGMDTSKGEFEFVKVDYNSIKGSTATSGAVNMLFYGEAESSDVELLLLYGTLSALRGETGVKHGIVTNKSITLYNDDETRYKITVNNGNEYYVKDDIAINTYIRYNDALLSEESDITILDKTIDLSGDMSTWHGKSTLSGTTPVDTGAKVYYRTVKKVDSKRIYFYDDSDPATADEYFFNPSAITFLKQSGNGIWEQGSYLDEIEDTDVAVLVYGNAAYNKEACIVFYR